MLELLGINKNTGVAVRYFSQFQDIFTNTPEAESRLGNSSVAVSSDGSILVAGNATYKSNKGQVEIFKKTTDGYVQIQTLTYSLQNNGQSPKFGAKVAITGKGDWIAVTVEGYSAVKDYYTFKNVGAVQLFQLVNGIYTLRATLTENTPADDEYFGKNITFSEDGSALAIVGNYISGGTNGNYTRAGKVSIYNRNAAGTGYVAKNYFFGDVRLKYIGSDSVKFSADGNYLVLSDRSNQVNGVGAGAIRFYYKKGETYNQKVIYEPFGRKYHNRFFGSSVSISADGSKIFAYCAATQGIYIIDNDVDTFSSATELKANTDGLGIFSSFNGSLDFSGDKYLVFKTSTTTVSGVIGGGVLMFNALKGYSLEKVILSTNSVNMNNSISTGDLLCVSNPTKEVDGILNAGSLRVYDL